MKTSEMPMIPYVPQNEWETSILKEITTKGHLKASLNCRKASGVAYYVWRIVAFSVSPVPAHSCMPVTADFYIKMDWDERRKYIKETLDPLVDRIVDSVPKLQWHGVMRWVVAGLRTRRL